MSLMKIKKKPQIQNQKFTMLVENTYVMKMEKFRTVDKPSHKRSHIAIFSIFLWISQAKHGASTYLNTIWAETCLYRLNYSMRGGFFAL
jgi:hypothetical protein